MVFCDAITRYRMDINWRRIEVKKQIMIKILMKTVTKIMTMERIRIIRRETPKSRWRAMWPFKRCTPWHTTCMPVQEPRLC